MKHLSNEFAETLKYAATLLLLFTMGIGQMWGTDETSTYDVSDLISAGTITTSSINDDLDQTIDYITYNWTKGSSSSNVKISSQRIQLFGDGQSVTISTSSSYRIKSIRFAVGNKSNSPTAIVESASAGTWDPAFTSSAFNNGNYTFTVTTPTAGGSYTFTIYKSGATNQRADFDDIVVTYDAAPSDHPTVTYYSNGATSGTVPVDANSPYTSGDDVIVLGNTGNLEKTNKDFAGWNTKADGTGITYNAGDEISNVTTNISLYAKWVKPATGSCVISYALTKGKADVSGEASVTTISSLSTAFAKSTLSIGSDNSQDGYCGQITGHGTSEHKNASNYVSLVYTVADGYTFSPSAVSLTVKSNYNQIYSQVELTDGITSVLSEEFGGSTSDESASFAANAFNNVKFSGTVTVYVYQWMKQSGSSKRAYIKSPVTIIGTVAAACSAPTNPEIEGNTSYTEGDNISLAASATGTDESTTYTWYKGDTWVAASAEEPVQATSTSGATYTKNSCVAGDAGTYWCSISNGTDCDVQIDQVITVSSSDPGCEKPGTPADPAVDSKTHNSATISWDPVGVTSHSDGYKISVIKKSDASVIVDWTSLDVRSYAVTGLSASTEYTFKVKAIGEDGYCTYGDEATLDFTTNATPTHSITYTELKGSDVSAYPTSYTEGVGVASFDALADVTDFHFTSWSPASIGTDAKTDQTIEAQWVNAYNVSFDKGAATGTAPSGFQKWEGATFNLPGQGEMVAPSGKVFNGWKAGGVKYAANAEYTMTAAAVEFVAQWKSAPTTLFEWTAANTNDIEADNTDLSNATYGTLTRGTSVVGRSFAASPNKMTKSSAGYKLGNNDVCIEIQGTAAFAVGDTVIITGKNGGTGERCFAVAPPTTTDAKADTTLTNKVSTETDNSVYKVLVKSAQAGTKLRIFRQAGNTMYCKSIKVVRPAAIYTLTAGVAAASEGYGTVAPTSVADIDKGEAITISTNTLTVAGTTVTATPTAQTAEYDYAFSAWQKSDETAIPATVTENLTVQAVFTRTARSYSVTYELNGATGTTPTRDNTAYGSKFNLHNGTTGITVPEGKEFDKWKDQDENEYAAGAEFTMPAKAVTLTAQWRNATVKHSITYTNLKEQSVAGYPTEYSEGIGIASFADLSDIEGWRFTGWSPSSIPTTATTDQTIEAQWTQVYSVTYSLGGASGDAPTETPKAVDESFDLPAAPLRDGYSFRGWECNIDDMLYAAETSYTMTAAATTFTAMWRRNTYTLFYYQSDRSDAPSLDATLTGTGGTLTTRSYKTSSKGSFSAQNISGYVTGTPDEMKAASGKKAIKMSNNDVYLKLALSSGKLKSGDTIKICGYGTIDIYKSITLGTGYNDKITSVATGGTGSGTYGVNTTVCVIPEVDNEAVEYDSLCLTRNSNGYITAIKIIRPAERFVVSTVVELTAVKVNDVAISATDLATLKTADAYKVDLSKSYVTAPTVKFNERTTVTYDIGDPKITNREISVTASEVSDHWQAQATIDAITYTVTMVIPDDPALETETTALTLESKTINTDTKTFTFSGANLEHSVNIVLASEVDGMSVSPAVVIPIEGAISNQEVTITYRSLENVAEANVNLMVYYSESVKLTIPLTYSSTRGYSEMADVTGTTEWHFASAGSTTLQNQTDVILANMPGIVNDENFNSQALRGTFNKLKGDGNSYQGSVLQFHTTVPGMLIIEFSGTNDNERKLQVFNNAGIKEIEWTYNSPSTHLTKKVVVPAGDVILRAFEGSNAQNVRIYNMTFDADLTSYALSDNELGGNEREVDPLSPYYGTICLPKAGVMVGATIFEVSHMTYLNTQPYKVFFDEVLNGTMEAGKPYIFLPYEGVSAIGVFYTGTASAAEAGNYNGLYGTFDYMDGAAIADKYIFYHNTIFASENPANWLNANRAYIVLSEVPGYNNPSYMAAPPAPGRRRVAMGVNAPKVPTGIENAEATDAPRKIMIDGTMFILRGENLYDATGRLVK